MTEFSSLVSQKWNIPENLAQEICRYFEEGDSIFFVADYVPNISIEYSLDTLAEIYRYLSGIAALAPKKKRVNNALAKAGVLNDEAEQQIQMTVSSSDLDDMLLPFRPNPRSKAQQAIKKGLAPLADRIAAQEDETGTVEELAEEYVGKHSSLKTVEDVVNGVKDILVERFAYDTTVRSMVRDFGYEDGFFEVNPKNKKDRDFAKYRGRMISVEELTSEELLMLFYAEDRKLIRLKHGVQLFRITELLRHHFIENPDAVGFDLISDAIDECWSKFLQPLAEKHVKSIVREKAEEWALHQIQEAFAKEIRHDSQAGQYLITGILGGKDLILISIAADGRLLGATREKLRDPEKMPVSSRLRQFNNRYRPQSILLAENDLSVYAEGIVKKTLGEDFGGTELIKKPMNDSVRSLAKSEWMSEKCGDLDSAMKQVYALGLIHYHPLPIMPQIGVRFFSIHPLQKYVSEEKMNEMVAIHITEKALHEGILPVEAPDSVLNQVTGGNTDILAEMRKMVSQQKIQSKTDLQGIPGMTPVLYRNLAGYTVVTTSDNPLDRTTVHPDHFEWLTALSEQLLVSAETLVSNPEALRTVRTEDVAEMMYIQQQLIDQLKVGQKRAAVQTAKTKRRLRLAEISEGTILPGRVTNITQFGVFVDINAVCDGLVHISQLADGYVENPEQVVSLNDRVDVRVVSVDRDKKRVSLSMKNLGEKGPKIKPSQGQLSTLADHFKNR